MNNFSNATNILQDLQTMRKRIYKLRPDVPKHDLDKYCSLVEETEKYIHLAEKFYIGNMNEIKATFPWKGDEGPFLDMAENCRFPYPITLWEGELDWNDGGHWPVAYLVIQPPDYQEEGICEMNTFTKMPTPSGNHYWQMHDNAMLFSIGKRLDETDFIYYSPNCSDTNMVVTKPFLPSAWTGTCNRDPWQFFSDAIENVACALLLMDCKNVQASIIRPSEGINKSRKILKKMPFYSYHVLTIKGKIQGTAISGSGNTQHRLHLCRGHWKEYTANSPLFGRFTGRYWWQAHVRGNAERGVIEKGYKLQIAQGAN